MPRNDIKISTDNDRNCRVYVVCMSVYVLLKATDSRTIRHNYTYIHDCGFLNLL